MQGTCEAAGMRVNGCQYSDVGSSMAWRWAHGAFSESELPDRRLVRRAMRVASDWAVLPGMALGRASGDQAGSKAGYRLLANRDVTSEALAGGVFDEATRRCVDEGTVFVAQDTTTLSYGHRGPIEGLGPVTTSGAQGLLVHSSLAVLPSGVPVGLLDQRVWTRCKGKVEDRKQRPIEEKESRKWLDGIHGSVARFLEAGGEASSLVFLFDREGDIQEVFETALETGVDVIVRSSQVRSVAEGDGLLDGALRSQAPCGAYTISVPRQKGGRPSRLATLTVRHARLTLHRTRKRAGDPEPLVIYGVLVTEEDPPAGEDGLEWRLLTTRAVKSYDDAVGVAWAYSLRWRVEEFHLVLKSGCRMEAQQYESAETLAKALAVLSGVATLILRLTYLARTQPDAPATLVLDAFAVGVLQAVAESRLRERANGPPTLGQVVRWIGRLGGHSGRNSDGPPGVRSLWRGWRDLELILMGARAAVSMRRCG